MDKPSEFPPPGPLCVRHTYDYASNEIHHWADNGGRLDECDRPPAFCESPVRWGGNGRTAGSCRRRGYETYVHGEKAVRCWQHDPLRGADEGEEAYRDPA